jgi:hypothetical protein
VTCLLAASERAFSGNSSVPGLRPAPELLAEVVCDLGGINVRVNISSSLARIADAHGRSCGGNH